MAVTVETYSLSAGWTPTQFWDAFVEMFVDAGYITAQYDRFTLGSGANTEYHLVLEVVYSPTLTFGKRYYRFMLYNGSLWYVICNGWNATTHVPTGSLYVDYPPLSLNNTAGWTQMATASTSSSAFFKRFTSGVRSTFSAFLYQQGATNYCPFLIPPPGETRQPWLDLDKTSHGHVWIFNTRVNQYDGCGRVFVGTQGHVKRDAMIGTALRAQTSAGYYNLFGTSHYCYTFSGYRSADSNNIAYRNYSGVPTLEAQVYDWYGEIVLPIANTSENPAYTSNKYPIFGGLAWYAYHADPMPSDFGAYGSLTFTPSVGDDLIVSAGVEEWEVISKRNNINATSGDRMNVGWCVRVV